MYVIAHNGAASLGGGELAVVSLLHGLQGRGHRVLMLCRDREMAKRVKSYGIPADVLHLGGSAMLHDAARMAIRLRRERPDALLLTTFKKLALAGAAARIARVPRVVQRIGLETDRPARGLRYRWSLRHLVDAVAVNAEAMREAFLAAAPRRDPARVLTVYHGPRVPPPSRGAGVRRELGIPPDAPVVGAVARLARQKRFDRLLRALAALPADVHCVIAGEGGERPAIEALAAELGVAPRLHLTGFRRDVADVLRALDVYVVCSEREGMANAMLEAMACGIPVVSTAVSGADEALRPFADGSRPGEIVGPADGDLAAALRRVLADPAARRAMGEAGRRRVEERFGYEEMLDRWEAVLAGDEAR